MRICLVSREFAPFWGAGIGTYASLMARCWAEAGHEVHVLSANHEGYLQKAPKLRPGVKFHAAQPPESMAERRACAFEFQRRSMNVFRTLERLHDRELFDYIEFPDYWAEGYFALKAKRNLRKFHGVVMGVRLHMPTALCRRLNNETTRADEIATLEHMEAEAIKDADVLISPSRGLVSWVEEYIGIEDDQPVSVVPYPFDLRAVRELVAERHQGTEAPGHQAGATGSAEPTVLYFGRLERRKGVEHLVEAARHLLDSGLKIKFRFIGGDTNTGPGETSMLEHLRGRVINFRPDRFGFEPARPRAELGEAIRSATVVCFPALWDNFPNTLLEAMALNACVIASDAGGMGEIVEDGVSGVLFHGGNTTNLAATIRRVLSEDDLRETTSRNARARVLALCHPKAVVDATVRAVEEAKAGPRTTPEKVYAGPPPKGGLAIPVPHVKAEVEAGGLMGRLKKFAGRVRGRA